MAKDINTLLINAVNLNVNLYPLTNWNVIKSLTESTKISNYSPFT